MREALRKRRKMWCKIKINGHSIRMWKPKKGDQIKCYYAHSASRQPCVGPCELNQGIGITTQHSAAGVLISTGTWRRYFLPLACLPVSFLVSKNEGGHGQCKGSITPLIVTLPSRQSPPTPFLLTHRTERSNRGFQRQLHLAWCIWVMGSTKAQCMSVTAAPGTRLCLETDHHRISGDLTRGNHISHSKSWSLHRKRKEKGKGGRRGRRSHLPGWVHPSG